jgi:hypothetical protein
MADRILYAIFYSSKMKKRYLADIKSTTFGTLIKLQEDRSIGPDEY